MQVSNQSSWQNNYILAVVKSFLLWTFTLTVCFLVVGFPVVVVMMTVGVLGAVVLQSIFPASAILLVTGSIFGGTSIAIMFCSLFLTLKGVHPHEVRWLGWLHDNESNKQVIPLYSSCPLTCDITHA